MASITQKERKAMPQLVWDCMQYNLDENEAMVYINSRIGRDTTGTVHEGKFRGISKMTYYYYKRMIKKGKFTQNWLNEFTKIGYVISHHKLISAAEEEFNFIERRLFFEKGKPQDKMNIHLIMDLHEDLRQQTIIINRLNDTTPIVAQVRSLLERQTQANDQSATESRETVPTEQQVIPPVE